MNSRRIFLQTGAAAAAYLASGVWTAHADNAPGVTDTEIKFGESFPYSGPASSYSAIARAEAAYFKMMGVAVGMFAAFLGLAVGVATILQFPQQLGNARGADFVTHRAKRRRQLVVAFGDPSQRSHRIAHRRRLEQSFQVRQKRQIFRRQPRAAPALASHLWPERAGSRKSFRPRPIVLGELVAREAAAIPP